MTSESFFYQLFGSIADSGRVLIDRQLRGLARQPGRAVTDLSGTPFELALHHGRPILASSPSLVDPLLNQLVGAVQRALASPSGT